MIWILNASPKITDNFLCVVLVAILFTHCYCFQHKEIKYVCPKKTEQLYPCKCANGTDDGIFLTCEKTNLAILGVATFNLGKLSTKVDHFLITEGNISRIYGPVFAKVKARMLTISHTPIASLEEYSLYGINETLETLNLVQSNLLTFPLVALQILGKLTELNIDGHAMEALENDLFIETEISHNLETLRIVNGNLSEIKSESMQNLKKLKVLDLHGNRLEKLKKNQFKNLRDVEFLDLSFNSLEKIESQQIADLTKLGWLNISNNKLSELPRGTFARNSILKVLNLSFNQIQRLDGNTFRGMRFLRRLFLNDNKITEVGRGTFGSVTKIGTINLARNFLKKIDFQMFSQLKYVEILDIAENIVTEIQKHSFKDLYHTKINLSHNAIDKIEPFAFVNCINITILDLSFNNLTDLSKNAFDMAYATELQVTHNLLKDLLQVPLHNMTGIKLLNVSYNQILTIPKNTFPKLYELHTIDLSYNNVTFIANGVFQTLFSLRNLNLSYNNLKEINSSMFGSLSTLLELDLSYNNLTLIARSSLAKLSSLNLLHLNNNFISKLFQIPISLKELCLSRNKLNEISPATWPIMNSLLHLDLSDNELSDSLNAESFSNLLVLQTLVLDRNGISKPPAESLSHMSTLRYLYINENNITVLNKNAFGRLPVLFELSLHGNKISEIRKRAFNGLLQLLSLNLSRNILENIPNEAFFGLSSLRVLDLSQNFLTKLDNKSNSVLEELLSLEKLNLSDNKISFITKKTFPSNAYIPYNLTVLDLSRNLMPVLTYEITFGTKKLKTLNVSQNHINEIRKGVLGNLTSLKYLDLSYNDLTDLSEKNTFDLPENLTEIYLQYNSIRRILFHSFMKKHQMEVIDLRANQLEDFPLSLVWNLENGTNVLFQDNPLDCNCGLRPLKHFIESRVKLKGNLLNIMCNRPTYLKNNTLKNVNEENFLCSPDQSVKYSGEPYEVISDIRFREISIKENNLICIWYANSYRDIADFVVFLRNEQSVIYQIEINYSTRAAHIPLRDIQNSIGADNNVNLELCVVTKTSDGRIGRLFDSQCTKLRNWFTKKKLFATSTSSKITYSIHLYNTVFLLTQLVVFM